MIETTSLLSAALAGAIDAPSAAAQGTPKIQFRLLASERAGEQLDTVLLRAAPPVETEKLSGLARLVIAIAARRAFAEDGVVNAIEQPVAVNIVVGGLEQLLSGWRGMARTDLAALRDYLQADLYFRLGDRTKTIELANAAMFSWRTSNNIKAAAYAAVLAGDAYHDSSPRSLSKQHPPMRRLFPEQEDGPQAPTIHSQHDVERADDQYRLAKGLFESAGCAFGIALVCARQLALQQSKKAPAQPNLNIRDQGVVITNHAPLYGMLATLERVPWLCDRVAELAAPSKHISLSMAAHIADLHRTRAIDAIRMHDRVAVKTHLRCAMGIDEVLGSPLGACASSLVAQHAIQEGQELSHSSATYLQQARSHHRQLTLAKANLTAVPAELDAVIERYAQMLSGAVQ